MNEKGKHTVEAIEKLIRDMVNNPRSTKMMSVERLAVVIFDAHVKPLLLKDESDCIIEWLEDDALAVLRDPVPEAFEYDGFTHTEREAFRKASLEYASHRVRVAEDIRQGRHITMTDSAAAEAADRKRRQGVTGGKS